jgi:transcriptional regulator with GAF, ATPase, and Fis domain
VPDGAISHINSQLFLLENRFMKIWLRFLGEWPEAKILDALRLENLYPYSNETGTPQGGGVVFFNDVTPQLFDLLRELSRRGLERVLAVASSCGNLKIESVWKLLQAGASDVFAWDHSGNPAREAAARFERWEQVDEIIESPLIRENLVGRSSIWIRTLRPIIEAAKFTSASLLILGESGTGKELIARLIHTLDSRLGKKELIISDCTTIVPELSGSEFFGHERGAFTGAVSARDGAFALADGGTLFLDEVGELPPNLQAELLRVVQERTYKRVGGNTWQKTDFRLVCATNRDLMSEQSQGRFRSDLYYRIASWVCMLPPLRERREDILPLAKHFISELRPAGADQSMEFDDAVRDYLLRREYPGNVRDLKQLITRIAQRHVGPGPITVGDIPESERPNQECEQKDWRGDGLEDAVRLAVVSGVNLKEIERTAGELAERIVLEEEQGNLQRAAFRLGVTDRTLQMRRAARRQNGESMQTTG